MRRFKIQLSTDLAALHMRPCWMLANTLSGKNAVLTLSRGEVRHLIDPAIPMMSLMEAVAKLGLVGGIEFHIECEGPDQNGLAEDLCRFFRTEEIYLGTLVIEDIKP